jgi:hypothetical protein
MILLFMRDRKPLYGRELRNRFDPNLVRLLLSHEVLQVAREAYLTHVPKISSKEPDRLPALLTVVDHPWNIDRASFNGYIPKWVPLLTHMHQTPIFSHYMAIFW